MVIKTKGLIVKHRDIGENDRIITILTEDLGVIEASAKGVSKGKSKLSSSCQLLCYNEFVLFKGRNNYIINSADVLVRHNNIPVDMAKTALAIYLFELVIHIHPDEIHSADYLRLCLVTMHYIEHDKRPLPQIKAVLELRLMAISGYAPNLVACHCCAGYEFDSVRFYPSKGYFVCDDCDNDEASYSIVVPKVILQAMRHIVYADIKRIFLFSLDKEALNYLGDITQGYLFMFVNRPSIKSLDVLKQFID